MISFSVCDFAWYLLILKTVDVYGNIFPTFTAQNASKASYVSKFISLVQSWPNFKPPNQNTAWHSPTKMSWVEPESHSGLRGSSFGPVPFLIREVADSHTWGIFIFHCNSVKYDYMLHWISIKYAVSRTKMPHLRDSATSLMCGIDFVTILRTTVRLFSNIQCQWSDPHYVIHEQGDVSIYRRSWFHFCLFWLSTTASWLL